MFFWSNIGPTLVVPSIALSWEGRAVELVSADHLVLSVAQWLGATLFADLSGLLFDVPVLLSFLEMRLYLEPVDLLWPETMDLFLSWEDAHLHLGALVVL